MLLDDTATVIGEKQAEQNVNSLKGFELVDKIKEKLEAECPGTVSCADLLAIAARDAVVLVNQTTSYLSTRPILFYFVPCAVHTLYCIHACYTTHTELTTENYVLQVGGPYWDVPVGRLDSKKASLELANNDIPTAQQGLLTLIAKFWEKGLDATDMVALVGMLLPPIPLPKPLQDSNS